MEKDARRVDENARDEARVDNSWINRWDYDSLSQYNFNTLTIESPWNDSDTLSDVKITTEVSYGSTMIPIKV